MCYYFDDIIKFEDFDLDNILIDEKSYEHILVYNISYKTLFGTELCVLDLIKYMDLLEFMMELDIQYNLELKKYDSIYNRIKHLIKVKNGITYVFFS